MVKRMHNSDFHTANEWFKAHWGFADIFDALPSTGFMAFADNKPIAAIFFYQARNSRCALLSWNVSNPDSTKEQRDIAFIELMFHCEDFAKDNGYKYLIGLTSAEAVAKRYIEADYKLGDHTCQQFIKKLGE